MSFKLASSLHGLTLHSQRFSYALNRKKQLSANRDKSNSGHLNSEALNPEVCQVQALAKGKDRAERWGPATCGSIWVFLYTKSRFRNPKAGGTLIKGTLDLRN